MHSISENEVEAEGRSSSFREVVVICVGVGDTNKFLIYFFLEDLFIDDKQNNR